MTSEKGSSDAGADVQAPTQPADRSDVGHAATEARAAVGSIAAAFATLVRFAVVALVHAFQRVVDLSAGGIETASTVLRRHRAPVDRTAAPVRVSPIPSATGAAQPTLPWRFWLRKASIGSAFLVPLLLLIPIGYAIYCLSTLPVQGGIPVPNQRALVIQSDDGQTVATRGNYLGTKLEAGDMPKALGQAVVAIEDRRFYQHHGIDLRGTLRAIWRDVRAGGESREGGSTLTQQLVRITYLSPEKTLRRKVQEALLSLWIETRLSKQEILTRYLNTAYFGAGAYGVDAAAHRYFGKVAKDLTLSECAMLAGLVRAPSSLAPTRNFGGADERKDVVLQAMVDTGVLTDKQNADARAEKIALQTPPDTPPGAEYFLDMVAAQAGKLPNGATGDLTLHTTLNMPLQRVAEGIVERRLEADGERKKISQAALVAMRPDGSILALVGGRDYEQSQFNRATQAQRQPGSLFKLFVYLAAFQRDFTPDSTMVDQPVTIGDWSPQNDDSRFRGRVDLRTAFADSINTVAAQLGQAVGIPNVIATARKLGITSDLPEVPSLVLGSADVSLMEMTRAYANVAGNTTAIEPFGIAKLTSGNGQVLYTRPPRPKDAPIGPARDLMVDAMQAVVDQGTGRAAHPDTFAAAGKTGTSQDFRNAWFIGFTPNVTVGIWVGNDDNSPMNREFGGDMPAKIFHDFVEKAEPVLTPKAASVPDPQTAQVAGAAAATPSTAPVQQVQGRPEVIDTGTLAFRGHVVHLQGVEGNDGPMRRRLIRFLRRREVACDMVSEDVGRCQVGGQDLSTVVISGGGAKAQGNASPDLLAAEDQARSQRVGMWR